MSNFARRQSGLVTIEKISPNKHAPRNKIIRRITPHCVAGNLSVESTLGLKAFQSGGGASTSYAIGTDGRIGLGVEETNRPWTSSSAANDNEAITFEIANNGGAPDWRMSDAAINTFLKVSVDICKFYGYKKVSYQPKPANITGAAAVETWIKTWAKPDQEMIITLHNWYANKACPGPYFMRQIPWLVREMNKRLQDPLWVPEAFIGESATFQPLKSGSKGEEVRFAQQRLNLHGANPALIDDGNFGPLTTAAVQAFEAKLGVVADGVIDQIVWLELNKNSSQTPPVVAGNEFKEYKIRINVSALNVRTGPGTDNKIACQLVNDKNIYTITKEADGAGAPKWGKLKSGAGWIALIHTSRI